MTYKPRNRNMSGHDGRNSTARWFDDRRPEPARPCGFEPWRWLQAPTNARQED